MQYFSRFSSSTSSTSSLSLDGSSFDSDSAASACQSATTFLNNYTLCLLTQASKCSNNNNGQVGSKVEAGEEQSNVYQHAIHFCLLMLDGCNQLLNFALEQIAALANDVRFDVICARETIMEQLLNAPLSLLQPLLSCLFSMRLSAPIAASLLIRFQSLLSNLTQMMEEVPSILSSDTAFISGNMNEKSRVKSQVVESPHPAHSFYEAKVSIPGATSILLEPDSTTAGGLNSRCRTTNYYLSGTESTRRTISDNSSWSGRFTFPSFPHSTLYVVYQPSSNAQLGNGYGFKLTATATVQERQVERMPFFIDLARHVALVAGRVCLVMMKCALPEDKSSCGGKSEHKALSPIASSPTSSPNSAMSVSTSSTTTSGNSGSATSTAPPSKTAANSAAASAAALERFIQSDFLSEGLEWNDETQAVEEEEALSWLPPIEANDDQLPCSFDSHRQN